MENPLKVTFHDVGTIADGKITFVVIVARFHGEWLLVRHRERKTLEIPGGHREAPETLEEAAHRELFEETGAADSELFPIAVYSVTGADDKTSYGQLYFAEVWEMASLPESEIAEVYFRRDFPTDNLTYPLIQPFLYGKALEYLGVVNPAY